MNQRYRQTEWMPRWLLPAALGILAACSSGVCVRAQDAPNPSDSSAGPDSDGQARGPADYAAPMPRGKKLVLTDGSYQIVREYERQGDRVRYYSVERSSWEEIPAEMVDWAATEKAGAETAAAQKETIDRLHAAAVTELSTSINTGSSLLIGSGVFLPDSPGFYVLNGQTVLGLIQVEATSRLDTGRAVLRGLSGVPFITTKRFVELPGKQAKLRIQSQEPEFFIRTVDARIPNLTLVRLDIVGDKRHVTTVIIDLVGEQKYEQKEIPMLMTEVAQGVQRIVMKQKLDPGEYGLLETTKEGLSLYVWEFGVDGKAASAKPSKK